MLHGETVETPTPTATETITETNAASGHCQTAEHSTPRRSAARPTPAQQATTIAARAFSQPCAPECAAAALSLLQARRPREAAALSIAFRLRSPTPVSTTGEIDNLSSSAIERRGRIRPRAPPISPANLSA
jgi:hypothetical protein